MSDTYEDSNIIRYATRDDLCFNGTWWRIYKRELLYIINYYDKTNWNYSMVTILSGNQYHYVYYAPIFFRKNVYLKYINERLFQTFEMKNAFPDCINTLKYIILLNVRGVFFILWYNLDIRKQFTYVVIQIIDRMLRIYHKISFKVDLLFSLH